MAPSTAAKVRKVCQQEVPAAEWIHRQLAVHGIMSLCPRPTPEGEWLALQQAKDMSKKAGYRG